MQREMDFCWRWNSLELKHDEQNAYENKMPMKVRR